MLFIFRNDINLKRETQENASIVSRRRSHSEQYRLSKSPGLIPLSDSALMNSDLKDRAAHINYL